VDPERPVISEVLWRPPSAAAGGGSGAARAAAARRSAKIAHPVGLIEPL